MQIISSPVSRLHSELLIEIFQWIKQDPDYRHNVNDAILILTWVCRQWRYTTIHVPHLWNVIFTAKPQFLQECILRSGSVPLTFISRVYQRRHAQPILQSLPQTKSLTLDNYTTGSWSQADLNLWKTRAPLLKDLKLTSFTLPIEIFAGCAPLLHTLYLSGCSFELEGFPPLPGLRILTIINAGDRVCVFSVLDLLKTVPQLRSLSIQNSLMDEASGHNDRVPLPKLRFLSLKLELFNHINELLKRIAIPATAKIDISVDQVNDNTREDDDAIRIIDAAMQCRILHSNMTIRSLSIVPSTGGHAYTITEHDDTRRSSMTFDFEVDADLGMVETVCSHLDLRDLEKLEVKEADHPLKASADFWIPFANLQNLHTVKLCTSYAANILVYIIQVHGPIWDKVFPKGDPDVAAEGFRELAASTLSFASMQRLDIEHLTRSPALHDLTTLLAAVLRVRWLLGRPLDKLIMRVKSRLDEESEIGLETVAGYVKKFKKVEQPRSALDD